MSCEDIPSLLDLQKVKKHADDFGRLMGTGEGNSTNEVTGQVRPTYNKVMKNIGFRPGSGDFTTGFTIMPGERDIAWYDPVSLNWYSYLGIIPSPSGLPVAPGTNPVGDVNWKPVTDELLREELSQPDGYMLVGGSASEVSLSELTTEVSSIDTRVTNLEQYQGDTALTAAHASKRLASGSSFQIGAFGDSTMWGARYDNTDLQDPNNPPSQLALAMSYLYGLNVTVSNLAISGSTMRGMIAGTDGSGSTFETKIAPGGSSENILVAYCNHGINDSAQNLNIDQYRQDTISFVRLCRKYGKIPILVTPNPNPPVGGITETQSKRLLNYVNVMRDVAAKLGCDIVDQYKLITESFNIYKPTEIVPDGAHLTSAAYKQTGFNLAIPLISVNSVSLPGDCAGLTNSSYFDNLTNTRQLQTQDVRTGRILSGNRPVSGDEGINFPVMFDLPQKVFSIIGLQWDAAANCKVYDNGVPNGSHYNQRRFGSQSALDWDSDVKFYGRKMAGLHIIGMLFDTVTPGVGNGMTFAGIAIPKIEVASMTPSSSASTPYPAEVASCGDAIYLQSDLPSGVNVRFDDKSGSQMMTIEILSGVLTVKLYNNGSVVQTGTSGTGMTEKTYGIEVITSPTSVTVTLDFVSVTLAVATPLPAMKVSTQLKPYVIKPSHIIPA